MQLCKCAKTKILNNTSHTREEKSHTRKFIVQENYKNRTHSYKHRTLYTWVHNLLTEGPSMFYELTRHLSSFKITPEFGIQAEDLWSIMQIVIYLGQAVLRSMWFLPRQLL